MKKILIVGAGGIGSYLSSFIANSKENGQLDKISVTISDNDTVDTKNLGYQNYSISEITENKAAAISLRYGFTADTKRIESAEQFKKFDCVISAVDNTPFRKLLFNECSSYWIDLRSEGRQFAAYTKHPANTLEYLLDTLPKEEVLSGSCQRQYEFENNIIQTGNVLVAAIGRQMLLNWYRGEENLARFSGQI